MRYKFSDKELKVLLDNIVIVIDTREQVNNHITDYYDKRKIKYIVKKLDQGDYSCYIESNEDTIPIGVTRDWYFDNNIAIERKNGVDELIQSIKDRDRFENEFARLNKYGIATYMLIEDKDFYTKLATGDYISDYKKESAIASFETLVTRYDIKVTGHEKREMGFRIKNICKYFIRELFKNKGYIE